MIKLMGVLVGASLLSGCGCTVIDTGHRGIKTNFGEIQGEPLPEGLYFYNPFTSDILELSVREEKFESKTECFTRDTQRVDITYVLTFYPDPDHIDELYKTFGRDIEGKVISPTMLGALKNEVGQLIADELVHKRDAVRQAAFLEVQEALGKRNLLATRLDLTNLDFDDKYEAAVEAKVVAIQKAAEAKNKTVEVEEQAKQTVIAAEAEAKSMQIKSETLEKNQALVSWEAVSRWDGKLPTYLIMGKDTALNTMLTPTQ